MKYFFIVIRIILLIITIFVRTDCIGQEDELIKKIALLDFDFVGVNMNDRIEFCKQLRLGLSQAEKKKYINLFDSLEMHQIINDNNIINLKYLSNAGELARICKLFSVENLIIGRIERYSNIKWDIIVKKFSLPNIFETIYEKILTVRGNKDEFLSSISEDIVNNIYNNILKEIMIKEKVRIDSIHREEQKISSKIKITDDTSSTKKPSEIVQKEIHSVIQDTNKMIMAFLDSSRKKAEIKKTQVKPRLGEEQEEINPSQRKIGVEEDIEAKRPVEIKPDSSRRREPTPQITKEEGINWEKFGAISGIIVGVLAIIITIIITTIQLRISKKTEEKNIEIQKEKEKKIIEDEIQYLNKIIDEYQFLTISHLTGDGIPEKIELEKLYVPLKLIHQSPSLIQELRETDFESEKEYRQILHRSSTEHLSIYEAIRLFQIVNKKAGLIDFILIMGHHGAGKTTLLKHVALTYSKERKNEFNTGIKPPIPIYMPLGNVFKSNNGIVSKFLDLWPKKEGLNINAELFEEKLMKGECIFLLDGLDEVGDSTQEDLVAKWISKLQSKYDNCTFIVTSRLDSGKNVLSDRSLQFKISDFDDKDIKAFAQNWWLALKYNLEIDSSKIKSQAELFSQKLINELSRHPKVRQLASNPLMLSIIVFFHIQYQKLLEGKIELYEKCLQSLCMFHDDSKKMKLDMDYEKIRLIMQKLAYWFHTRSEDSLKAKRADIENYIKSVIITSDLTSETILNLLNKLKERSGIIFEDSSGFCFFKNLIFQEYLTAREIVDRNEESLLLKNFGSKWWEEVILLYVNIKPDSSEFINDIFQFDQQTLLENIPLVIACLDQANYIDEKIKKRVNERSMQLLNETEDKQIAFDSSQLINRLLKKNPKSIIPLMIGTLSSTNNAIAKQWYTILLGQSQTKLAVDILKKIVINENEEFFIRYHAIAALGELKAFETCGILVKLLKKSSSKRSDILLKAIAALVLRYFKINVDLKDDCESNLLVKIPGCKLPKDKKRMGVIVDPFYIDIFPVTNAEYQQFVDATEIEPPFHWGSKKFPEGKAFHPVVNINYNEAQEYARWKGKRLVSEEEWEIAANGLKNRLWPWGNTFDKFRCNTAELNLNDTTPVYLFPLGASFFKCMDMAGNVWEWTNTLDSNNFVMKGGSFKTPKESAMCANSYYLHLKEKSPYIGFRCAEI